MKRADLCIRDTDISKVRKMAQLLNIDVIGSPSRDQKDNDIVYRVDQKPSTVTEYRYLVVADDFEQVSSSYQPNLVVVKDFEKIKSFIRKRNYKSKIALEVLLSDIRYQQGYLVGNWFKKIRELYRFCRRSNLQFIVSSGANTVWEMTSVQCFESVMRLCGIPTRTYWEELEGWLEIQDGLRLSYAQ